MTYNEFEQRIYNGECIEDVIELCVKYPELAREFELRHKHTRLEIARIKTL